MVILKVNGHIAFHDGTAMVQIGGPNDIASYVFEYYAITDKGRAAYHDEEYLKEEKKEQQEGKKEQRSSNTFILSILGFLFTIGAFVFTQISKNNAIDKVNSRLDSVEAKLNRHVIPVLKIQPTDSSKVSR